MKRTVLLMALISPISCFSSTEARFLKVPTIDFPIISDLVEVKNLPRVRSQGPFNICFGMSSNVVAQHYFCNQRKIDCQNLSPRQEISPLSTTAYAISDSPENTYPGIESFTNLDLRNGQSSATVLLNLSARFQFLADSCFPFDKVVQKYGVDYNAFNETLLKLENIYEGNKQLGIDACLECVQKQIEDSFGFELTAANVKLALKQDTFNHFLFFATIGNSRCNHFLSLSGDDLPYFQSYPIKGQVYTYEQKVETLKRIVKGGRPADLAGICLISEGGKCHGAHSVAVTGYRKQCTPKGECREVLRIQNSWGEEWQKNFNDGWIDARTLLDNSDRHVIAHLRPRSEVIPKK